MNREENVIKYYLLCNRLKNTIRKGWIDWKVSKDRIESVAEHIYSVQQLAILMWSEYKYDIDIKKVCLMIAIHETGETITGDLTQFDISKEEKERIEHNAVHDIFSGLASGKYLDELFLEYDAHQTAESKFAYQCDKFDCDMMSKIYDKEGYVDINHQEGNKTFDNPNVKRLLEKNNNSFSGMWIEYGQEKYPYDENFMAVSKYLKEHNIEETLSKLFEKDKYISEEN